MAVTVDPQHILQRLMELKSTKESYASANAPAIHADWLQKMRQNKRNELLNEATDVVEGWRHRINHQVGSLQALLQTLQGIKADVEASQHIYNSTMTQILAIHQQYTKTLIEPHTKSLSSFLAHLSSERNADHTFHSNIIKDIGAQNSALREFHGSMMRQQDAMYGQQRRALQDDWDESCGLTRVLEEERAAAMETDVRNRTSEFCTETAEDRKKHDELLKEDTFDSANIDSKQREIGVIVADIETWRGKLVVDVVQWKSELDKGRAIKGQALEEYTTAQHESAAVCKKHEELLKAVSSSAGLAEKQLGEVVETAERVVRALAIKAKKKAQN